MEIIKGLKTMKERSTQFIKVSQFAIDKSGYTKKEILNRYKTTYIGYDGSFALGEHLFNKENGKIIWLGNGYIEIYKRDLEIERQQKEAEAEKQKKLFSRQTSTKTERRRANRASKLIAHNFGH